MLPKKLQSLLQDPTVKAAENCRAEGYATPLTEMAIKAAYGEILFSGRLSRRYEKLVKDAAAAEASAIAQARRDAGLNADGERARERAATQAELQAKDMTILALQTELRARELELREQDATRRKQSLELREQTLAYREMLLRNGIDPDTGDPLPNFHNGNNNANNAGNGGKP